MDLNVFNEILDKSIDESCKTLQVKADEYVNGEDRLSNFKQAAVLESCTPVQALGGMLAKHVVALFDFIARGEDRPSRWSEKITDIHNYLYLLTALLIDEGMDYPWKR